jgi:DNA-binding winged helix-turn-helix (wHTH) protein
VSRWCGAAQVEVWGVPWENAGKFEGLVVSLRFGAFEFYSDRRQLLRDGREVHLTPKAFDLLALLVREAPAVVSKPEIHSRLWPGTFVSDATLAGVVKELRRALGDDGSGALIRTAHRVGFAFTAPLEATKSSKSAPAIVHWLELGSRRIPLTEGANVIGRDPSAAVWLDVAGVSRRHAQVLLENGTATLEDLGSKNGTLVGDRPVRGRVRLHDADRIQVATEHLVFRSAVGGISTATQPRRRSKSDPSGK